MHMVPGIFPRYLGDRSLGQTYIQPVYRKRYSYVILRD